MTVGRIVGARRVYFDSAYEALLSRISIVYFIIGSLRRDYDFTTMQAFLFYRNTY